MLFIDANQAKRRIFQKFIMAFFLIFNSSENRRRVLRIILEPILRDFSLDWAAEDPIAPAFLSLLLLNFEIWALMTFLFWAAAVKLRGAFFYLGWGWISDVGSFLSAMRGKFLWRDLRAVKLVDLLIIKFLA